MLRGVEVFTAFHFGSPGNAEVWFMVYMIGLIRSFHSERWPEPPLDGVYRLDPSGRFVTLVGASTWQV